MRATLFHAFATTQSNSECERACARSLLMFGDQIYNTIRINFRQQHKRSQLGMQKGYLCQANVIFYCVFGRSGEAEQQRCDCVTAKH